MKFTPVALVVVMALGALAAPAFAQSPDVTGGNVECTVSSGLDGGSAVTVSTNNWSNLDFNALFLASIHGWMGSNVQTPARFGMPSARAVRFASAGKPGARVTRVTRP